MKKILYITLFTLVSFFYSCNKQEQQNRIEPDISQMEEIEIDAKKGTFLPFDDCIEKMDFIKLETTDDNLIGKISQILFTDNLLIVVDSESSKAVYIYDMQGHFKYKIHEVGNGPSEYVDLSNVMLVPTKKQLAILDRAQHKVIYFNLEGKYLSYERIPFMLINLEFDESGNKLVYIGRGLKDPFYGKYAGNTLLVVDKKNHIIAGAFPERFPEQFTFYMYKYLWKYGSTAYYSPNFSNIIYTVNDTLIKAKYHIHIKENGMPPLPDDITNEQFENNRKKYLFFNGDFVELQDYTYLNIFTPWGKIPSVIYSHEKQTTFLCSGTGSHPFHAFLNNAPIAGYGENCIVLDVQPHFIMAYKTQFYQKYKKGVYKAQLDSLYEGLQDDDNSVLFFYHLKIK